MSNQPRGPLKPLVFEILLVLLGSERHGYGIVKEVEARTDLRLEPANLYRTLRGMLRDGWIEESGRRPDPEVDDQRRRYFRISALGTDVARAESERLERLVTEARTHDLLSS